MVAVPVREYTGEPVDDEILRQLVDAAIPMRQASSTQQS